MKSQVAPLITPRVQPGFVAGGLKQGDSEANPRISLSIHLLQVRKLPLRFRARGGSSGDVALAEEELGAVLPFSEQVQIASFSNLFPGDFSFKTRAKQ